MNNFLCAVNPDISLINIRRINQGWALTPTEPESTAPSSDSDFGGGQSWAPILTPNRSDSVIDQSFQNWSWKAEFQLELKGKKIVFIHKAFT